jgi:hypothetical protein
MSTTTNATSQPLRVLPDDVYDALEFAAEVYGGVGRGSWWRFAGPQDEYEPWCGVGLAHFLDTGEAELPVSTALCRTGLRESDNDEALVDVPLLSRISFSEWCRRLNVVRASDAQAVQAGAQ